jgi:hypothetical protein
MTLDHTVRLFNTTINEAFAELKEHHVQPDCIITHINNNCFGGEITIEKMRDLGERFKDVLIGQGHIYLYIDDIQDLGIVMVGMQEAGLTFKNILTIPYTDKIVQAGCNTRKYFDGAVKRVLYFTKYEGHFLNHTKLFIKIKATSMHPAVWNWFKGTISDSYKNIMQISTQHADTILDPFMLTDAIGKATVEADRHYIGINPGKNFNDIKHSLEMLQV